MAVRLMISTRLKYFRELTLHLNSQHDAPWQGSSKRQGHFLYERIPGSVHGQNRYQNEGGISPNLRLVLRL